MGAGTRNAVTLSGEITTLEALRHTPAGLPLIHLKLAHCSMQAEAGIERQTVFEIGAVAIGDIAGSVTRFKAGDAVMVQGFLAGERRSGAQIGRYLILHITNIQPK